MYILKNDISTEGCSTCPSKSRQSQYRLSWKQVLHFPPLPHLHLPLFFSNLFFFMLMLTAVCNAASKMEGSIPCEATQLPSPTSPKIVHFSTTHPTIYHAEEEEEEERRKEESPKPKFSQKLLSGFKSKQAKAAPPRKKVTSLPKRLPERKPFQTLTIADLTLSSMDNSIEAQPYKWPHNGGLSPETTALVIIDMQKDCEFSVLGMLSSYKISHFRICTGCF